MEYPKKLIEVALPLDDINKACAREKSIRHGHPSNLHRWWARRPIAAARAVLFAQLVNDPGGKRGYGAYKGQTKEDAQREREKLFDIIRDLVKWENINNEEVYKKAKSEILKSWIETCKITGENSAKMPAFHDPFSGGGAIPLEAQRLGLDTYASDLNPVAVLINKAMIEIPPKFINQKPIGPIPAEQDEKVLFAKQWRGAEGLAEDVYRYGYWIREQAYKRLEHLYPKVKITNELVKSRPDLKKYLDKELNVISWIWARTVKSPNPAFNQSEVPLTRSLVLSKKKNKECFLKIVVNDLDYSFEVVKGKPSDTAKNGTKLAHGANFQCVLSGSPISADYIKSEAKKKRLGKRIMALVLEGDRERVYLAPDKDIKDSIQEPKNTWKPDLEISGSTQYVGVAPYNIQNFSELFTERQLFALNTLCDLIKDVKQKVVSDGKKSMLEDDGLPLEKGGEKLTAYAEAIMIYCSLVVSKLSDSLNTLCPWEPVAECSRQLFNRQAISMAWEFAEGNVLGRSSGSFLANLKVLTNFFASLPTSDMIPAGFASNCDATTQNISKNKVISIDPPYYDNVPYADISDFFYVWLRHCLKEVIPSLFLTIGTPKVEELVAFAYRHSDKDAASKYFMEGMTRAIANIAQLKHPSFPLTIYYAFKQSETKEGKTISTGWEVFIEAVIRAGFSITGTWPMRTELNAALKTDLNTLASSIILVCNKKEKDEQVISRSHFQRELKNQMPLALEDMIGGIGGSSPIAPVDLAQAAIGPGMAIFSKYKSVLEADGTPMSVHNALILINKSIDEYFTEVEGEMDEDTRFCLDWFQQYGFKDGVFGEADVLARAKGTSVEGVQESGVLLAKAGKVRLWKISEYPADWDPVTDKRTPIWEACHHMCKALEISETRAGELLAKMPEKAEAIRQLAYRLYTLCERKGWAEDAGLYNGLITSWHAILEESHKVGHAGKQKTLFDM